MTALIVYTLAAFGLAWAIGHSKLSQPFLDVLEYTARDSYGQLRYFRWLTTIVLTLLTCPACLGFHIGWAAHVSGIVTLFPSWYVAAFYTCGANLILGIYTGIIAKAQ